MNKKAWILITVTVISLAAWLGWRYETNRQNELVEQYYGTYYAQGIDPDSQTPYRCYMSIVPAKDADPSAHLGICSWGLVYEMHGIESLIPADPLPVRIDGDSMFAIMETKDGKVDSSLLGHREENGTIKIRHFEFKRHSDERLETVDVVKLIQSTMKKSIAVDPEKSEHAQTHSA